MSEDLSWEPDGY